MKNCIVWSFWVWKTTLVEVLKADWLSVYTGNERTIIEEVWNPKGMDYLAGKAFQRLVEIRQMNKEEIWNYEVSDSSFITILAYNYFALDEKHYKESYERITDYLRKTPYDYIFYIPIEFGIVDDWVRFIDENLQKKIDDKIKDILTELWLKYITLTGAIENRKYDYYKHVIWITEDYEWMKDTLSNTDSCDGIL